MGSHEDLLAAVKLVTDSLKHESATSDPTPDPNIEKHILQIDQKDADNIKSILAACDVAYKSVKNLKSDDPGKVIVGVLDIVGAFAPMAGPAGVVVSSIAQLVSHFISDLSGWDTGASMQSVIDEALRQYRNQELTEKAAGVGRLYSEWQRYMSSGNQTLTHKDLDDLLEMYNLQSGTEFLGELLANIKGQKEKRTKTKEAKELLHVIQLYCQLSIMRELLLHQMYVLIVNSKGVEQRPSTVRSFKAVLDMQYESYKPLEFLHRPTMAEKVISSVYRPDKFPEIALYLKRVGMPAIPVPEPALQELRVKKWPGHFCRDYKVDRAPAAAWIFGWSEIPNKTMVRYHYLATKKGRRSKGDYFCLRSGSGNLYINSKDPDKTGWYHAPLSCSTESRSNKGGWWGLGNDIGSNFKLTLTKDNKVLLASDICPDKFMYITRNGYLDTFAGDPGSAGYWMITTQYTE